LPWVGIQKPVATYYYLKVAIYKYHTNEFVYKNEGVGAIVK
jgi:hypothetical protein